MTIPTTLPGRKGAQQGPGRDPGAPGRARPTAAHLRKGPERAPRGLGEQPEGRAGLRAEGAPRERDSSGAGPGPQASGGHSRDPALPRDGPRRGGPRTARTLLLRRPDLCRSAPPPREHPGPCGLGAAVVTAGADSRAGETWPPPVGLSLLVSPCAWERRGCQGTGASPGQQLPLSPTPGRGAGQRPGAHTCESAQQPLPRRPAGRSGQEQVHRAALESSRASPGIYTI